MKFNFSSRLNIALIAISIVAFSPLIRADGITSGIAGIQILFLFLLGCFAFSFLLAAIILRANNKLLFSACFLVPAIGFFVIWIVRSKYFDLSSALNPWLAEGTEKSYIAVISYFWIVGIAAYLLPRFKYQIILALCAILAIPIQAVTTPGVRIQIDNNPLSGEIRSIDVIEWRYGRLDDGRVVYLQNLFEKRKPISPFEVSLQPLASDGTAQRYRLMFSREVGRADTEDMVLFGVINNPLRPLNVAQSAGEAIVMDSDWVATDAMLFDAVRYSSSYHARPYWWVNELLDRGANPNYVHPGTGASTLSIAARREKMDLLRILIEAGGDVNMRFKNHDTLLHLVAENLNTNWFVLEYLLDKGADPALVNQEGKSPVQIVGRRIEETTQDYSRERLQKMRALLLESQND